MASILKSYSKEELASILKESTSLTDFLLSLGYSSYSGSVLQTAKKYLEEIGLKEEYRRLHPKERCPDNIFIKDSTACQKVLRQYYYEGGYTEYKCSICGQPPYWNNQPLTLILDHVNGQNKDNRLENLRWVCPNCNQQLPTTGSRNRPHKKKNRCVKCGKIISTQATYCSSCSGEEKSKKIIESYIDRETLKAKIRTESFESIAIEYGKSSGNTIKRWCDYYGLPRLKKDIKSYTDEEWQKI